MPIRIRQSAPQTIQEILPIPPAFPDLPRDVLQRFPSLARWEQDTTAWYRKLSSALQDSNRTVSQTTTAIKRTTDILGVELIERFDELEDEVGNLFGKYTLQVVAGDVVTGMVLTSQSGDTPISSVKFQADQFQIWNGSSGQAVFDLNGSDVRISGWTIGATTLEGGDAVLDSSGTLILGTSNDVAILSASNSTYRLWIGNATAGSAAFSVTKTGVLSATNGIFSGTITSTSGTIGGFTIGVTDLSAGSGANYIMLSSSGSPSIDIGTQSSTTPNSSLRAPTLHFYEGNDPTITMGSVGTPGFRSGRIDVYDAAASATISLAGSIGVISASGGLVIAGQSVTYGAADSGGTGFKVLRVPN
jgi:hypothetical protein